MEAQNKYIHASERVENAWDDGLNSSPQGLTTNLKLFTDNSIAENIFILYCCFLLNQENSLELPQML